MKIQSLNINPSYSSQNRFQPSFGSGKKIVQKLLNSQVVPKGMRVWSITSALKYLGFEIRNSGSSHFVAQIKDNGRTTSVFTFHTVTSGRIHLSDVTDLMKRLKSGDIKIPNKL